MNIALRNHARNHPKAADIRAFDLDNRMTIVLFAGLGGACDGLEQAGFHVHVAINHDPVAIAVHKKRHPHTLHLQTDVFEVDPRDVCRGRGVRFLHASPDCTHFSVAKGGKPVSKRRRSLAWVVCRWMGRAEPEVVTLENVREIQSWGPLIAKRDKATGRVVKLDGSVAAKGERVPVEQQWLIPDPRHKGRIWRAWLKHVARLGYHFECREIVCADHGVWTIRKRLFGVATCDGSPIVWPERTHAPRSKAKQLKLRPWRGIHEKIDWSLPVKSIFGRPKELADATKRRIARGIIRYVITAARPFIAPITHSGDDRVHSVDDPARTFTTAHRGEMSLVVPHLSVLRNAEKPHYGADEPAHAFTAGGANHMLIASTMVRTDQHSAADRNGVHDLNEPINTMHTSSSMALIGTTIAPIVIDVAHGEGQGRGVSEWPVDEPLRTVTASHGKSIVAATMHAYYGGEEGLRRNGDIGEPLQTFVTEPRHAIVAATMVQTGYGERKEQKPRALDIEEPIGTQVAGGGKAALVAAFMAQHNYLEPGHSVEDPCSTIVVKGCTQALVAASMLSLHGTNRHGHEAREPMATMAAGGTHAGVILAFLQHYFSSGKDSDDIEEPLGALTGKVRHGLVTVTVGKVDYVITDICQRMLTPEEGAAAHGFAPGALPDEIEIDGKVRRLTKTEKYHLVGNSVPPEMIRLLAVCNGRRELMVAAE